MNATRRMFLGLLAAVVAAPKSFADGVHRLFLPKPTFESFVPPQGTAYQWCAKEIMGEPSSQFAQFVAGGWKPVPAERYNKSFAIKGEEIEFGGQVLMERARKLVDDANYQQLERARSLEREWLELVRSLEREWLDKMKEQGFTGGIKTPISGGVRRF